VESEDEDEEEETMGSTRPLTSRQAVLASVVDSSHVSLCACLENSFEPLVRLLKFYMDHYSSSFFVPPFSECSYSLTATGESFRKKKQLTESELALRREETARKRRNLTEKKLEDEKVHYHVSYHSIFFFNFFQFTMQAETINRLLKKQSKSKAKRSALSTAEASASEGEREVEQEEKDIVLPTSWRWVSSTRPLVTSSAPTPEDGVAEGRMHLILGVPVSVLPTSSPLPLPLPQEKPRCDVPGCIGSRKYRLVRDWVRGACGLTHLKVLEAEARMDVS